ncbi:MAG: ABC transporter permease [Anaerolineae bacterium]|nr:ABC transporter permease [Candidatus Roseilinea sp.]MDW8451294.1 ABC transporter permease [Anaerolineae bacterium]
MATQNLPVQGTPSARTAAKSAAIAEYKPLSPAQLAWRRFRRNRLAIVGLFIVLVFIFAGVFAPVISPFPYDKTNLFKTWLPPGRDPAHVLGTDELGRDILSRLIWGARVSLIVSLAATGIVVSLALLFGFLSGYFGGAWDYALNRMFEVIGALPGLLFQILLMLLIGNGILQVTIAISILGWPGLARLVRAQVLAYKERDFVSAARSLGATTPFIMTRHLLPNIINPLIVAVSFAIPGFIGAEAGLSFLGYGINDPLPSWGKMVGAIGRYLSSPNYLYVGIIPTVALALLVLGFSFLGDGLRDALDPSSDRARL